MPGLMQNIEYKNMLTERVVQVLRTIFDPEIPVNIYELGLIYDIIIDDDSKVHIRMTLTSPNCPVAEDLPVEVHEKVKATEGVEDVQVTLTFEPPWDRNMISDAGLLDLGFL
jgi:FeS assembly SUF system protein